MAKTTKKKTTTTSKAPFRALHDYVVLERSATQTRSAGGIELVGSQAETPCSGTVVAVGPGIYSIDGELQPMDIVVGDVVYFNKKTGEEIKLDGKTYLFLRQKQINAVAN